MPPPENERLPGPGPSGKQASPNPLIPLLWVFLILLILGTVMVSQIGSTRVIRLDQFEAIARRGLLAKVTLIGKDRLNGELRNENDPFARENRITKKFSVLLPAADDRTDLLERLRAYDAAFRSDTVRRGEAEPAPLEILQEEDQSVWLGPLLLQLLPAALIIGVMLIFFWPRIRDSMNGPGGIGSFGKAQARRFDSSKISTRFTDVAGMASAKRELEEVVEFLKDPQKFQRLGAQVPKGVLLVGPPGTGKTLLARAVAGEAGVPFFSINGSEFIQMFVGVGASRVRDLFRTAKENAPSLLYIDEIDAVGRMRGAGVGGGSDEREQTLNQILSEMDGFSTTETVIVLASTNRPDVLDAALLRPGRFDRHITVDRPNWQERLAILKVHTRNKPLADDVDLELLARKMIGMTGADLRNLTNEAAILATRENKSSIEKTDFERAADRILIGPKREEVLSADEKRRTAIHEAGHALVGWLMPQADKPLKVSIIPHGRALGVNLFVPEEERFHYGRGYFQAKLVGLMGGRAADRLVYGEPNAGAESDLKQATRLARQMVVRWGMSDKIGPMAFRAGEEHVFLGKEIHESRDFSDGMARMIDEEVQRILREADQQAFDLLAANRSTLERLADALVTHEEMDREAIDTLIRGEAMVTS